MSRKIHIKVRTELIIALFLGLWVIFLYSPVIHFSFINYDDLEYVVANTHVHQGLNLEKIKWAFRTFYFSNWHPITWLSYMFDFQFFGLNAGWFHLVNLLFHMVDSILLFGLLYKLTRKLWPAAAVAVLFALHPLHVESVAWVSERKDVLSTFFFLSTLFAYSNYAHSHKKIFWYIFAIILFVLGLMAKPMVVTLPFVLLLLDYWPLERHIINNKKFSIMKTFPSLVLEKIPFFLLSGTSCILTILAQRGAISPEGQFPFSHRIANAVISYGAYIGKMFYPAHLALPYPFENSISWGHFWLALLFLLAVTGICIFNSVERPYLLVGWLWYLGSLVPVIGILQVGVQAMADRYTYIPLIGIFIMMSWECSSVVSQRKTWLKPLIAAFGLVVIVLSLITRHQIGFWKDSITLFRHSTQETKNNYVAYTNLGQALMDKGNLTEASKDFLTAIKINPQFSIAYLNLGVIHASRHEYQQAELNYRKTLSINPGNIDAYCNLGNIYFRQGNYEKSEEIYRKALVIKPDSFHALNGLGGVYIRRGKNMEAISSFKKALATHPTDTSAKRNLVEVYNNLGNRYFRKGDYKKASEAFVAALKIDPESTQTYNGLGAVFSRIGNYEKALFCFKKALTISPHNASARKNLEILMKFKKPIKKQPPGKD